MTRLYPIFYNELVTDFKKAVNGAANQAHHSAAESFQTHLFLIQKTIDAMGASYHAEVIAYGKELKINISGLKNWLSPSKKQAPEW